MSAMLRVDGAVVFWSLGTSSSVDLIRQGWEQIGPAWGRLAPKERNKVGILHDALSVVFPRSLLRPLEKREGFAVLHETRFKDEVSTICTHAVAIDESTEYIDFRRGYDMALRQRVVHEYDQQKQLVKPIQVATALIACVNELAGVSLRPSGGFYWLSDAALPTWDRLVAVVKAAGKNNIYQITHNFDAESIRAVRDAVLAEAEKEADAILSAVESGELGERGLKSQARAAENLQRKVQEYERILGEALPAAAAIASKAELTAVSAHLTAASAVGV